MKIIPEILILISILYSRTSSAQTGWYLGIHTGAKISFSTAQGSEDIYDANNNSYQPRSISYHNRVAALATQHGLRIGYQFKESPFKIESGLSLGGHVLNFTPAFGSEEYLGDKLSSKLTYYLIELPVLLEYILSFKMKSTKIGAFLGGKANFLEFRPYWGEASPWNKHHDYEKPLIQTVYFVPESEMMERRYIKTYKNYADYQTPTFSITGGCSMYLPISKAIDLRITASYTQGTMLHLWENIEVKSMHRDDFGVLILSRPEESYYSTSKTSNIAIDVAIIFKLLKRTT